MVVTASQNPPAGEPQTTANPPGPTPVPGAWFPGPGPGPYRGSNPIHSDRQQQPNVPFFYVQPSQPYLPYQWPMPMSYVPYGGFPGFGYGMVLPPFPPAPYVDTPGYVLPHNQMHMVDYRRMITPHLAPAMAYQARRFRYQHTAPSSRVMVSCEVQTDSTLCGGNAVLRSQSSSDSGRHSGPESAHSSPKQCDDKSGLPEEGSTGSSQKSEMCSTAPSNGGILFEAEEVRFECTGSPSGLKVIRSEEIAELARNTSAELLHCNMGSAEDLVLTCFQPVSFTEDQRRHMEDVHKQYLPPCPDILMASSCPSSGNTLEGSDGLATEPSTGALVVQGVSSLVKSNEDSMQHQLEQCLNDLSQLEASIWSVESLIPYVPSPGWLARNVLMTPQKLSLPAVRELPADDPPAPTQSVMPSLQEEQAGTMIELEAPSSIIAPESFLPSCSLARFLEHFKDTDYSKLSNVIINSVNSPEVQAQRCSASAPEKLNEEQVSQRTKTPGFHQSDQNDPSSLCPDSPKKRKRFCSSCLTKLEAAMCHGSPSLKGSTKRPKVAHSNKRKIPLCVKCLHDLEKKPKSINPGSIKAGCEVSENALYPVTGPKQCPKRLFNVQSAQARRHAEKCPVSHQSKLREQNCLCIDPEVSHSNLVLNRNGYSPKNGTRQRNEENISESWRDEEFLSQPSEKSRKGVLQSFNTESIKSGGKMTLKQAQCAQTQESHRKDTRI